MSNDFKRNHYVPEWYQKRFLLPGQFDNELYYLNLQTKEFPDSKGGKHLDKEIRRWGTSKCFSQNHLYTSNFGGSYSTGIEQYFFGEIDQAGSNAVRFFAAFDHGTVNQRLFTDLLRYMSVQKLRTIKGLGSLATRLKLKEDEKNLVLAGMIKLEQIFCSNWTESVWLIADASESDTKFIISDHPITVYNRDCEPGSPMCRGDDDPDIWRHGTHTLFPLSLDKILILTNLSWARNPYQDPLDIRPNPQPRRDAILHTLEIQTLRNFSESEVREINFIIKSRAKQFLAAADPDWLYPEKYLSNPAWRSFGDNYLLMPDPRSMAFTGELIIAYNDGTSTAFDSYGLRPGQRGFSDREREMLEIRTFRRFQGEFARLFGAKRRGRSYNMGRLDPEIDSLHEIRLADDHRNNPKPPAE